jgi:hypothetical protein
MVKVWQWLSAGSLTSAAILMWVAYLRWAHRIIRPATLYNTTVLVLLAVYRWTIVFNLPGHLVNTVRHVASNVGWMVVGLGFVLNALAMRQLVREHLILVRHAD